MSIQNIPTGTTNISRRPILNFPYITDEGVEALIESLDLKMTVEEVKLCQNHYKARRNFSITFDEIRIIDAVVRDGKRFAGRHLLTSLVTNKEYIAKTYEDMMARRRTSNPDYKTPPSHLDLANILSEYTKKIKTQKSVLDDMAIFLGSGKYSHAAAHSYNPVTDDSTSTDDAILAVKSRNSSTDSQLLVGDTVYAVLKSYNPQGDFAAKLGEFQITPEFTFAVKRTAYINDESIITHLAALPQGINLNTKPYMKKTQSYSCFEDYAARDTGIVFACKKELAADMLIEAQGMGLTVIKLGTLVSDGRISAYADGARIFSLSQAFLRGLAFQRPFSVTICPKNSASAFTESSKQITTGLRKYRLCRSEIGSENPFMSAMNSVIYNYSCTIASGANKDDVIGSGIFSINLETPDEKDFETSIALILGAYRAQCELSIPDANPKIEHSRGRQSYTYHTLSRINNVTPSRFIGTNSFIYYLEPLYDDEGMPDFCDMRKMHTYIRSILKDGSVLSILPTTDDFEASLKKIKGRTSCEIVNTSISSHFGGFIVESTKEIDGILIARTEKKETAEA